MHRRIKKFNTYCDPVYTCPYNNKECHYYRCVIEKDRDGSGRVMEDVISECCEHPMAEKMENAFNIDLESKYDGKFSIGDFCPNEIAEFEKELEPKEIIKFIKGGLSDFIVKEYLYDGWEEDYSTYTDLIKSALVESNL